MKIDFNERNFEVRQFAGMSKTTGSLDITRIQIERPKVANWEYWSSHDKFHCLKLELVVSLGREERIVWAECFKGKEPDVECAKSYLIPCLGDEQLVVDKGYRGQRKLWVSSPYDTERATIFHENARSAVERCNARLKNGWGVLKRTWRGELLQLAQVVNVCCRMQNIIFHFRPLTQNTNFLV